MPRIAKELSAIEVSRIHDQGLHFVGNVPGLILQVKGASRSWILRIPVGGKRRDIGLGGFPAVGLAQARNNARDIRIKVAQGIDPIQERRDQHASLKAARGKLKTFSAVLQKFIPELTAFFDSLREFIGNQACLNSRWKQGDASRKKWDLAAFERDIVWGSAAALNATAYVGYSR